MNVLPHPGTGHTKFAGCFRRFWLASAVLGVVTFTLAMCVGTLVVSIGIEPMLLFMFRSVVNIVPEGVRRMAVMLTFMGMPFMSGRGPYPGRGLAEGDG